MTPVAPACAMENPAMPRAAAIAAGTAQRGLVAGRRSQTTMTGATWSGMVDNATKGARQSLSSTPASMACARGTGIAASSRPSQGMAPVAAINTPVMMKAPTASFHPKFTAAAPASNAAPGVDHAVVMGRLVNHASPTAQMASAMVRAKSPEAAWAVSRANGLEPRQHDGKR